jgi:hypothetical protein
LVSCAWLYFFVDVDKSRIEQQDFLEKEKSGRAEIVRV